MIKIFTVALIVISLIGCEDDKRDIDQCQTSRLFKECMEALPAGPARTHYNDWSEVVNECRIYAHSYRRVQDIPAGCR